MDLSNIFVFAIILGIAFSDVQIARVKYVGPMNIQTSSKFLSVALDTTMIAEKFKNFNMTNEKLLKITKYLSPAYLRIGGGAADRLIFSREESPNENFDASIFEQYEYVENKASMPNFTMTGKQWTDLNKFASKTGLKIIFDLNVLFRDENDNWNSENAIDLISFSDEQGFDLDWELGNEPDGFKHNFDYELSPEQLAKDFSDLKLILQKYPRYKNSLLLGPDTTRPRYEHPGSAKYLKRFLNASLPNVLNGITFHQYYLNGHIATEADFVNISTFHFLEDQISYAKSIRESTSMENVPLWIGETSSAYGGGVPGVSNTFAASFLWLDKLGVAAKYGLKIVIRQALFHGSYSLIDEDYVPRPDWWLSILYKELVGPEVLSCNVTAPETVRLYCHCAAVHHSSVPSITVFGSNLNNEKAYVKITDGSTSGASNEAHAYIVTQASTLLTSKNIKLNGKLLNLTENNELPVFNKKIVDASKYLVMPPYSIAFWVVPSKKASVCEPVSLSLQ